MDTDRQLESATGHQRTRATTGNRLPPLRRIVLALLFGVCGFLVLVAGAGLGIILLREFRSILTDPFWTSMVPNKEWRLACFVGVPSLLIISGASWMLAAYSYWLSNRRTALAAALGGTLGIAATFNLLSAGTM